MASMMIPPMNEVAEHPVVRVLTPIDIDGTWPERNGSREERRERRPPAIRTGQDGPSTCSCNGFEEGPTTSRYQFAREKSRTSRDDPTSAGSPLARGPCLEQVRST